MLTYRTDYPNHVHQFVMAVSKHYHAGKDGSLKYQKKVMDVSLAKVLSSEKRHMIIYSLRDHCSGVFYSEISFAPDVLMPHEFLSRAWSHKSDYQFQGIPDLLMLPKTVQEQFPELSNKVQELGIKLVDVTSGFQGGIRDIRTIESRIVLSINQPIENLTGWIEYAYRSHAQKKSRIASKSRIDLWAEGVPDIRHPPHDWCK